VRLAPATRSANFRCAVELRQLVVLRGGRKRQNLNPFMYSVDDLLSTVTSEHAEQLRLYVGSPPIIVLRGEHHVVEGPPISLENIEQMLLKLADTRQRRGLRERGAAKFIHVFGSSRFFMVHAKIEGENVRLHLYSQAA